jgi:hypothetical protein
VPQIKLAANIQTGPFPYKADLGDSIAMAEYLGKSTTISLTLYNPKRAVGRMTIGFLHSFNNNFCAGAELLTEWMRDRTLQYSLALAARYVFCVCSIRVLTCPGIWRNAQSVMLFMHRRSLFAQFFFLLSILFKFACFHFQLQLGEFPNTIYTHKSNN